MMIYGASAHWEIERDIYVSIARVLHEPVDCRFSSAVVGVKDGFLGVDMWKAL